MCTKKQQNSAIYFVDFNLPEKASLFDYFSSIELIPLETSDDVLVASIAKIIQYQDKYYTFDVWQSIIFVFDSHGQFLYKINKKGQGPGEYSFIEDFIINPFSGNLELLQAYGSVNIYDLMGTYIETKRIEYDDFRVAHGLASIDSNIYVFHSSFAPKKIIYFDLNNKELLHEDFEDSYRSGSFSNNSFNFYNDNWFFFRPFHTGVYKLEKNGLEEVFRFDFGKYPREGTHADYSEESRNNREKIIEETFAQFPYYIKKLVHNNRYVLAQISFKDYNDRSNIIYDRILQKGKFVRDFTEKVEFYPQIITDDFVLSWCNWGELDKYINKEMLDDTQKRIFEELIQSKDETNPILIKYQFK